MIRAHLGDPRGRTRIAIGIHALTKSDYFGWIALIIVKVERIEYAWTLRLHGAQRPCAAI